MSTEPPAFPELLRAHRARLRLSQQKMAALIGISNRTYCSWERDDDPKRKPHPLMQEAALARLEKVCQIGDAELLDELRKAADALALLDRNLWLHKDYKLRTLAESARSAESQAVAAINRAKP